MSIYKLFKYSLICCFFCFCIKNNAFSQNYQNLSFGKFTSENGLGSNFVNGIVQDDVGYLWIATENGLSRFDGYSFMNYMHDKADSNSLNANNIAGLSKLKNGNILIHYYNRLDEFDLNSLKVKCLLKSNQRIFTYLLNSKNQLWITIFPNKFYLIPYDSLRNSKKQFSIEKYFVFETGKFNLKGLQLFEDLDGNLWFGNQGLHKYDVKHKILKVYPFIQPEIEIVGKVSKKLNHKVVNKIVQNDPNYLWLATGFGLVKFDIQSETFTHYPTVEFDKNNTGGNNINDMFFDEFKNIWLASNLNGIFIFNPGSEKYIANLKNNQNDENTLSTNGTKFFFYSKQFPDGILWVGTTSGINYCDFYQKQFKRLKNTIDQKLGLIDPHVRSMFIDQNKNLWIGTWNQGMSVTNKDRVLFEHFQYNSKSLNSIGNGTVSKIWQDGDKNIISLTWQGSINTINPVTKKINRLQGYQNNKNFNAWVLTDALYDKDSSLWISSIGSGLFQLKKNSDLFLSYGLENSNKKFPTSEIFCLFQSKQTNESVLWIGTKIGLIKFNYKTEKYQLINPSNDLVSIFCIFEDNSGLIWCGTETDGLYSYNPKTEKFNHFTTKDGISNNYICGIVDDKKGNLWISTGKGISMLNPKTGKIRNYYKEDGLLSNEFTWGSYFQSSDGELFFGGQKGLISFYPDSIKDNPFIPNVFFTDFRIKNKSVGINEVVNEQIVLSQSINNLKFIKLNYKNNDFSLEFSSSHYSNPNQNTFAYMLEGYDEQWKHTDANYRRISYTNLKDKEYIFKVKAANNDVKWNEVPKELKIIILPAWWQTLWFKILILVCIIVLGTAYYKYKTFAIKEQNRILEKKVSERTSEVMQQKEEIQQQAEELEETNEELIAQSDALRLSNEALNLKNYEIEKSFKISQVLSEFGQQVTSTFDLESINEIVYGYLVSIMPVDAFGIGLYSDKKNEIEYIGFIEKGNRIERFSKSIDSENSLTAWCFKNQKTLFISDLRKEFQNYINEMPDISTSSTPLSLIHLPLTTYTRRIGILALNSYAANDYTQKDLIHLNSFASYITIALDNAEAYKTVSAQKEKLLELDKFKEGMTGMIVHDLKNPLNAIIGISSLNSEDEMMMMINSAGNQMLNLVLNILDVQKFENTEVKLNLSESSALHMAEDASKQISMLIKQKNHDFSIRIDPKIIVNSDHEIVVRVFVNILTNAIKYTPSFGKITIKSEGIFNGLDDIISSLNFESLVGKDMSSKTPFCLFSVTDTGQGIPKDKQYLVFEKFGQIEAKKSGGVRSTGLGMTFCKMVIEAHGGEIWLTSEVGKGTIFWFTLPFIGYDESKNISNNEAIDNEGKDSISETKELQAQYIIYECFENKSREIEHSSFNWDNSVVKILAVDDDLYSLRISKDFLCEAKFNFYFIQVIDIKNSFEISKQLNPDIILMDWEMPEISGIEIIKQLKSDTLTQIIPVIMITSRSGISDIQTAFDAGAIDFVHKPIDKVEIINRTKFIVEYAKTKKSLNESNIMSGNANNQIDQSNKFSILYAEDSVELRSYISACLREYYLVIEAENGKEGLDLTLKHRPDLIISDYNMPEMDGIEFCKQLRENFEISHIPFIMLTAQQSEEAKIEGFKYGADDYINKPFSQNLLFARIDNLIKIRKDLYKQYYTATFTDHNILTKNEKDLEFLEKLSKIMEEKFKDSEFNSDKCADLMAVSRSTLYSKLQSLTGQSFNAFLRTIRLKKAAYLLKNSQYNVSEISTITGFNSHSWFSRCFTEQFGVSPMEFSKPV